MTPSQIGLTLLEAPKGKPRYFEGREETAHPIIQTNPSTFSTLPTGTNFTLANLIVKPKAASKDKNKQRKWSNNYNSANSSNSNFQWIESMESTSMFFTNTRGACVTLTYMWATSPPTPTPQTVSFPFSRLFVSRTLNITVIIQLSRSKCSRRWYSTYRWVTWDTIIRMPKQS